MNKKVIMSTLLLVFSLIFGIKSVFAFCDDCQPNNCEACGCVVNSQGTACIYENYSEGKTSCGDGTLENIPTMLPEVVSIVYNLIQIVVPILLIIFGSIDLVKGITSQKEDEMKKGQQMFIKRLIVAAIIFFVFVIVKLVISLVADNGGAKIIECAECFIKKECDE